MKSKLQISEMYNIDINLNDKVFNKIYHITIKENIHNKIEEYNKKYNFNIKY